MKNTDTPKDASALDSEDFNTNALPTQYRLFDTLPIPRPQHPSQGTLPHAALNVFLAGRTLIHPQFEAQTGSWRLSAAVFDLKQLGWPVFSHMLDGQIAQYGISTDDLRDIEVQL